MQVISGIPGILNRSALRSGAFRRIPEGLCSYYLGTGRGADVADLGEWRGHEDSFATEECGACQGTGKTSAKIRITPKGVVSSFLIIAGCLLFPAIFTGVEWVWRFLA